MPRRQRGEGLANQVAVRLPDALLEKLERYTERLRQERPGLSVTRAEKFFDRVDLDAYRSRSAFAAILAEHFSRTAAGRHAQLRPRVIEGLYDSLRDAVILYKHHWNARRP